ncbi:MAG: hypothetical protein ABI083_01895 [Lapillicoccus sp.]
MPPARVLVTATLAMAMSLLVVFGVAGAPTAHASAPAMTGYTFTRMVAGTPERDLVDCALNNLGQVAVASWESSTPGGELRTTVVRADGASVTPIAGPSSELGGWPGTWITGVGINDAGQVAAGVLTNGIVGRIVLGDGGPVRVVARSGPGERFYQLWDGISLNAQGRVAFVGRTLSSAGLYTGNGGPLATRFVNTDASTHYGDIGTPVLNAAGQLAFGQRDADGFFSIYRIERDGSVTRLHRSPSRNVSLWLSMNRAGRVVISRPPAWISTVRNAGKTLVASNADGFTAVSGGFLNDLGQVVFNAVTAVHPNGGVYTGATPSFSRVLGSGDVLNGHAVYSARTCGSTPINNAGQVALRVTYSDFTEAVVRADPVP